MIDIMSDEMLHNLSLTAMRIYGTLKLSLFLFFYSLQSGVYLFINPIPIVKGYISGPLLPLKKVVL
jgi:hypothetical protein